MSQPITNLGKGDLICIRETALDGIGEVDVPLRILCTPETNPYGSYYLVVREYAPGLNLTYNNSEETNYEGSYLDRFMTEGYPTLLSAQMLACIATSSITCYNPAESASYTLARKIFALSNKELHGDYTNDESVDLNYFTDGASRVTMDEKTGKPVYTWTRSPNSDYGVYNVSYTGRLDTHSPRDNCAVRPAFNLLSSCLVASVANDDGSYNLITDATAPNRVAGFTALLGETDTRPKQVKVDCDATYSGTLTVAVCNNYNDSSPTWESASLGAAHAFTNQSKTAEKWAVGVKIEAESEINIILPEPVALVLCEKAQEAAS